MPPKRHRLTRSPCASLLCRSIAALRKTPRRPATNSEEPAVGPSAEPRRTRHRPSEQEREAAETASPCVHQRCQLAETNQLRRPPAVQQKAKSLPRKRQRPEKADNRRNGPHTFPGLHHTPSARRHPTHDEAARSRDPDSAEAKSLVLSSTSLPLTAETMRLLLASLRHHHLAETRGSSRSGYAPAALKPAETSTTRRAQTDGPESAPAFRGLHPAGIRHSHAGGLDRRAARGSLGLPPSRVVSLKAATRLSPNLPSWPLLLRGANDPKHRTFRVSTASSLAGLSPDCRPSWASSPPDTHQR